MMDGFIVLGNCRSTCAGALDKTFMLSAGRSQPTTAIKRFDISPPPTNEEVALYATLGRCPFCPLTSHASSKPQAWFNTHYSSNVNGRLTCAALKDDKGESLINNCQQIANGVYTISLARKDLQKVVVDYLSKRGVVSPRGLKFTTDFGRLLNDFLGTAEAQRRAEPQQPLAAATPATASDRPTGEHEGAGTSQVSATFSLNTSSLSRRPLHEHSATHLSQVGGAHKMLMQRGASDQMRLQHAKTMAATTKVILWAAASWWVTQRRNGGAQDAGAAIHTTSAPAAVVVAGGNTNLEAVGISGDGLGHGAAMASGVPVGSADSAAAANRTLEEPGRKGWLQLVEVLRAHAKVKRQQPGAAAAVGTGGAPAGPCGDTPPGGQPAMRPLKRREPDEQVPLRAATLVTGVTAGPSVLQPPLQGRGVQGDAAGGRQPDYIDLAGSDSDGQVEVEQLPLQQQLPLQPLAAAAAPGSHPPLQPQTGGGAGAGGSGNSGGDGRVGGIGAAGPSVREPGAASPNSPVADSPEQQQAKRQRLETSGGGGGGGGGGDHGSPFVAAMAAGVLHAAPAGSGNTYGDTTGNGGSGAVGGAGGRGSLPLMPEEVKDVVEIMWAIKRLIRPLERQQRLSPGEMDRVLAALVQLEGWGAPAAAPAAMSAPPDNRS